MCDENESDIQRACRGDGQAYGRIVNRYQERVTAWMWRFTHDHQTLEELVQDVFVQTYFSLKRYVDQQRFEQWLFKIATNTGYRFWKKARRNADPKLLALEEWDGMAEAADDSSMPRALWVKDAMGRLGARDRLVLTLRYLEDRSVSETAQLTGWSQTLVKVQSYRARKRLEYLLAQDETDEDIQ